MLTTVQNTESQETRKKEAEYERSATHRNRGGKQMKAKKINDKKIM